MGIDARAYWRVDLAHPYASSGVGELLDVPLLAGVRPVPVAAVRAAVRGVLRPLDGRLDRGPVLARRPWPWALLILFLPWTYELFVGQVHLFIAAAIVLGFRWPALWAFNILTKVTPGVGLLWFLRPPRVAAPGDRAGTTAAIVAVSFLLAPTAWFDWYAFLRGSTGSGELLYPRIAARGDHRRRRRV